MRATGRAVATVAFLCLVAALPMAASASSPLPEGKARGATRYLFASVPWLTPADSLLPRLAERGYEEVKDGRQKDRRQFKGRLFERWTMITALLDDQSRLVRWEITIPAPRQAGGDEYASQRPLYDDAIAEMVTKYGPRRSAVDQFRFPYRKGDAREEQALNERQATIRSVWAARSGDRLQIALDERVSLILVYESPAWTAAEKERRRRKARDL